MMTTERLRELIAQGESFAVEFKGEERNPLSDSELVETVVCLANRADDETGYLLVGVEDDGRVTGAKPRHGHTIDPLQIQALIANRTRPSWTCNVDVIELDGKPILVIEVPPARTPVGTTAGVYKRRAIGGKGQPECLPYQFHEMQAYLADRGSLDYSTLVVSGASWHDLDPLEFERFRRFVRETKQGDSSLLELPDTELAKALGAVEANHEVAAIRVLGLLLFGKEESLRRLLPTHEVAFQVLSGTEVSVNDFFRWPLLRVMEALLTRFRARYHEEELMLGLLRIGVPEYSERAFREAVANALIHRDYTQLGAVHIQWHEEHIEISNPGGFPVGVQLNNLLVTPPRPRNPLLADAFKRAGIVERTGRGIDIIYTEQLRNGRPAPSYDRTTQNSVVVVLPGGKANLAFVRMVVEESQRGYLLKLDELLILNHLWRERQLTTAEAARLIQKTENNARAVLERLVEAGLVEARGASKGRTYHLSAATYRRMGEKFAYVRQRGFELLQQEQMVLQFVQKHGSISRSEVAELCQLSPPQAYRLLKRLEAKGQLHRIEGSTKAVRYGIARE